MAGQQEIAAIPLVEERISVGKRQVEAGRLRIRVSVDQREERVPVTLAYDEVEIERVPKNLPLSELPSVRLEGNTTIIPVVEEVVVVENGCCSSRRFMSGARPGARPTRFRCRCGPNRP
jgi:stress response protein YsnF